MAMGLDVAAADRTWAYALHGALVAAGAVLATGLKVPLGARPGIGHGRSMRFGMGPLKPTTAVRVMAGVCVALALMCAGLAVAWRHEHEQASCWQAAATYKLEMEDSCEG